MSYCRFENTANDLQDCYDNIEEFNPGDSSERENASFHKLLRLCKNIHEDFGWMEETS